MARRAANAAKGDPRDPHADYFALKFQEHFSTTDQETRDEVSRRFRRIAEEASRAGRVLIYCDDSDFRDLPAEDQYCNGQHPGQEEWTFATSNELSHIPAVFQPTTEDHGIEPGHPDDWDLTPEQARRDAYTHQRFAKAIFVREPPPEYGSVTTTHSESSDPSSQPANV
ncbi:MAG: hypothetical protein Q9160_002618 [Pyrenula sp. 1 TL-2023]